MDVYNEKGLKDISEWASIQQNTYTRWLNIKLKHVKRSIVDLQTDLADGLNLIALVEVLSGKTITKYNRKPNFRSQKLENISIISKFLSVEGIFLFNIDSTDIVDGNLKLILSLVWNIILHFEILMPMKSNLAIVKTGDDGKKTSKQRLLDWINEKIFDNPAQNFTSDWRDGKKIGALVHSMSNKLCRDWEHWDPNQPIINATAAMNLAEKRLNVPKLLRPDELVNPNVDEQSVMTYLSQFTKVEFKTGAPRRKTINLSTEEYRKLLDFLTFAGLDEKVLSNPKKAQQVKKWAESNDVYKLMDKRAETEAKRRSSEEPNESIIPKQRNINQSVITVDEQIIYDTKDITVEKHTEENIIIGSIEKADLALKDVPPAAMSVESVDKLVTSSPHFNSERNLPNRQENDFVVPEDTKQISGHSTKLSAGQIITDTNVDEDKSKWISIKQSNKKEVNVNGTFIGNKLRDETNLECLAPPHNNIKSQNSDLIKEGPIPPPPPPPAEIKLLPSNKTQTPSSSRIVATSLLDQINNGVKLNPVVEAEQLVLKSETHEGQGIDVLTATLRETLARFRDDVRFSDDDDDDEDEEEGSSFWSDDE